MKITAFMQNQWFNDPARVERMMERAKKDGIYWDYRSRVIEYALFAGCKSGKILKQVFGEEICEAIHWEEASPKCGGHSSSCFPADLAHMQEVIKLTEPQIILSFGKISRDALKELKPSAILIFAPHPAARHNTVMVELQKAKIELDAYLIK